MMTDCAKKQISIHAPTRGATSGSIEKIRKGVFQSTLPQGERRRTYERMVDIMKFQSTLPQGERRFRKEQSDYMCLIFQSTLPQGERLSFENYSGLLIDFNPRSHKGSDISLPVSFLSQKNFNPRSHKGSDGDGA